MQGTRISITDTSLQDKVDRVILPVMNGLSLALFMTAGGNGKNYAPDGLSTPVIHGSPVQGAFSKSFPTSADYIDTGYADNSDITIITVCKPAALPAGTTLAQIIGNWNTREGGETGKGTGLGIGIVQSTNTGVQLIISSVPTADAANPLATTGKSEGNKYIGSLNFDGTRRNMFLRVTGAEYYFKEYVKNVVSASAPISTGYVKDNRLTTKIKVSGANGNNIAPGPEAILTLIYNRGLTVAEMDSLNQWINSYCARRGL